MYAEGPGVKRERKQKEGVRFLYLARSHYQLRMVRLGFTLILMVHFTRIKMFSAEERATLPTKKSKQIHIK